MMVMTTIIIIIIIIIRPVDRNAIKQEAEII
jgi:hypothetical protein